MELFLYQILMGYFLIGAVITYSVNRSKEESARKKNWLKYFTYLFLVNVIFTSILFEPVLFQYISGGIIVFGLLELLIRLRKKSIPFQARYFIIYSFFAFFLWRFSRLDSAILFYTYFLVTIFDGFSQLSGQLFGRRRIALIISPNKTLEGVLGGLAMTILSAILIRSLLGVTVSQTVIIGFGIALFSFLGDLLASWGKRKLGIKDYSQWIPGHGGFLDRFDSLLGVAWFVFFFIKISAL